MSDDGENLEIRWAYERAERMVAEKVGFLRHLAVYMAVNVILLAINLATWREFLWFLLPLGGWGIILLGHFVSVFAFRGEGFERWRRREIDKEMKRLRRDG